MGSVTVFNSQRMKEIEDTTVVSGHIDSLHHLILTTREGTPIDAGHVHTVAQVAGSDSPSVSVTVTGGGSDADPFKVKAEVKKIPASAVDSGRFDLARIPDITAKGVLEASYRGGPAKVKLPGESFSSVKYPWLTPYQPGSSREVNLLKTGDSWKIAGQDETNYVPIEVNDTYWTTYTELAVSSVFSNQALAAKLPSGVVVLSGLLAARGTVTNGTVIGTIPLEFAPDYSILVSVEMGDQARTMMINPAGQLVVYGTLWTSTQYLSLDGITFLAKGVATWTPIGQGGSSWGASFNKLAGADATYGPPSFWKDPYGFVWFIGVSQLQTPVSNDNTVIVNLPAIHRADQDQHLRTCGNDGFSVLGFTAAAGLTWKLNSVSNQGGWISLSGFAGVSAGARTSNPWRIFRAMGNSWANYLNSFPEAQYLVREDGLRVLSGLIRSGTLGQRSAMLPIPELWIRRGRAIFATVSSSGRGRMDISGVDERSFGAPYETGSLNMIQGATPWYALDQKMWIP